MKLRSAIVALAVSLDASTAAAAAPDPGASPLVVRYVEVYSGPASLWTIQRGSVRLSPHGGLALQVGDCVTLDTAAGATARTASMTLLIEGREIAVDAAHAHYCVSAESTTNPVLAAISRSFTSFLGVFHDAESDYDHQTTTQTVTRSIDSPKIVLPALADNDQRIARGTRPLALAWLGGTAPFTVTLSAVGGSRPLASVTAQARHVRLPALELTRGAYRVSIADAGGLAGEARFSVVPESDLPAPSADVATILADAETPADVKAAFDAARLMADPSDTWRFEAYQRLVDHGRSVLGVRLLYQLENDG